MNWNAEDIAKGQQIAIAIIEPTGSHGGMKYYDVALASALASHGANVALFTSPGILEIPESSSFSARVVYNKAFGSFPVLLRLRSYLMGTLTALVRSKRERRQLVHFHLFQVSTLEAFNIILAKVFKFNIVITAHDVESLFTGNKSKWLPRFIYGLADGVIVHNQVSKREIIQVMKVRESRISIIPHGHYLHAIGPMVDPKHAKILLGIPEDARVLLFFGHIKKVKGLDLLIRAMPLIIKNHPDAILCIAGRPMRAEFAQFQELVHQLDLPDHFKMFVRFIEDNEVPLFFSASELVVLPYRRVYQSGVVLLAMSHGKPVLVSDIPGMTELITHDKTGFTFKSGNVEDLADVASRALSAETKVKDITDSALALLKNNYDWNDIGAATLRFYLQICERAPQN